MDPRHQRKTKLLYKPHSHLSTSYWIHFLTLLIDLIIGCWTQSRHCQSPTTLIVRSFPIYSLCSCLQNLTSIHELSPPNPFFTPRRHSQNSSKWQRGRANCQSYNPSSYRPSSHSYGWPRLQNSWHSVNLTSSRCTAS